MKMNSTVSKAMQNVQRSYAEKLSEAKKHEPPQASAAYIPGLTPRPQDKHTSAAKKASANVCRPKEVPTELIEGFLNGTKHPISALMEYASMMRLMPTFHEVAVEIYSFTAKFASECRIGTSCYPQGIGKTKKEAKTNAAKIAFTKLLGLDEDDVDDNQDSGTVLYDAMGRKLVMPKDCASSPAPFSGGAAASVLSSSDYSVSQQEDPQEEDTDGGQNPVSALQVFCSQNRIPFTIIVGEKQGPYGDGRSA